MSAKRGRLFHGGNEREVRGTSPSSKGCFKRGLCLFELLHTPQNTKVICMTQGYGELDHSSQGLKHTEGIQKLLTTLKTLLGSLLKSHGDASLQPPSDLWALPDAHMPYCTSSIDSTQCVPTGGQCKL